MRLSRSKCLSFSVQRCLASQCSPMAEHDHDVASPKYGGSGWSSSSPSSSSSSPSSSCSAHRSGRPLRMNLMSRYICFSQIGPFDVSFEELFSKVQSPGGFFRKKRFLGSIFGVFACSVAISDPICMKFWLLG